jgi:hypothetical protein
VRIGLQLFGTGGPSRRGSEARSGACDDRDRSGGRNRRQKRRRHFRGFIGQTWKRYRGREITRHGGQDRRCNRNHFQCRRSREAEAMSALTTTLIVTTVANPALTGTKCNRHASNSQEPKKGTAFPAKHVNARRTAGPEFGDHRVVRGFRHLPRR